MKSSTVGVFEMPVVSLSHPVSLICRAVGIAVHVGEVQSPWKEFLVGSGAAVHCVTAVKAENELWTPHLPTSHMGLLSLQ